MGAEMDECVLRAQREVESDVGVTGWQVGVVIGRAAVGFAAAAGLQGGGEVAKPEVAKGEVTVLHRKVVGRVSPSSLSGLLQREWECGEQDGVVVQA